LAGCYALLATLACSFLMYAHWDFTVHPPLWADQARSFVFGSSLAHAPHLAKALSAIRLAALYFRDRMHTTRLFFGVFAAVWLACLLWMQIGRRSRSLRRQALWILGMTLLVSAASILYGLGTRGVYAERIPSLMPLSDGLAAGFLLLILPLITSARIRKRNEQADLEANDISAGRLASLNLGEISIVPRSEAAPSAEATADAKSPKAAPSIQPLANDHTMIAVNRLMARATAPVIEMPLPTADPVAVANPLTVSEPPSVVQSTALALVHTDSGADLDPEPITAQVAEPVSTTLDEPFAALVDEHVDADAVAILMSDSIVEAPEAVYEPLPESVSELPVEHSVVEPIAFQLSGLIDEPVAEEAVEEPASTLVEEHLTAPTSELNIEPLAFHIHEAINEVSPEPVTEATTEPIALVTEEPAVAEPALHFAAEPVAVHNSEPIAFVAEEPVAAIPESVSIVADEPAPIALTESVPETSALHFAAEHLAVETTEPFTLVAEEPAVAEPALHFTAEPVVVHHSEPIALVAEEPVAVPESVSVVTDAPARITLTESLTETSTLHFAADHSIVETPEPIALVLEQPHTAAVPEPAAVEADEPVIALSSLAAEIHHNPETFPQLEPLPVSVATPEPIVMSAEPFAVLPLASVAAAIPAESVTPAQPEPIPTAPPVSSISLGPIAAVAADPIAALPPAQAAVVVSAEPVTAAQPEPVLLSPKPAEPIEFVPRESPGAVPPAPVAVMPPKPKPVAEPAPATPPAPAAPAREVSNQGSLDAGDEFLHGLSTLNRSWRRIEAMQEEMDEWFKQRRRQALAQAATPPAMRNSSLGNSIVQDLSEKMAAIDSQWAEIRNAALGITRVVGDTSDPDQNK